MNKKGFPSNKESKDYFLTCLHLIYIYSYLKFLFHLLPFGGTWLGWTRILGFDSCEETQSGDQKSYLWSAPCLEEKDQSKPEALRSVLESGVVEPQAVW